MLKTDASRGDIRGPIPLVQIGGADICRFCSGRLASAREREAQTCHYHLDVKKTPPSWNGG